MARKIVSKEGILSYMQSGVDVIVLDCVNSTNTFAKDVARTRDCANFVVVAREQTAGKGRYTRKFFSPKDCGVYFSCVVDVHGADEIELITPMVAIAVADAINEICSKSAKIKWVNDIIVDDKKCCGILCEGIVGSAGNIEKIVLGIGINLYDEGIDDEIKHIACAVGDGIDDVANKLVAKVVDNVYTTLLNFDRADVVSRYKALSYLDNKVVNVIKQDGQRIASVMGVDDKCNLVVKYQDETIERLSTGEVRIQW